MHPLMLECFQVLRREKHLPSQVILYLPEQATYGRYTNPNHEGYPQDL